MLATDDIGYHSPLTQYKKLTVYPQTTREVLVASTLASSPTITDWVIPTGNLDAQFEYMKMEKVKKSQQAIGVNRHDAI